MGRQLGSTASICSRERRLDGPRIPRTNSNPPTFLSLMTLRVYLRRSSVRLWSHRKLPAPRSGPSPANVERARWGAQWAADSEPDDLQWPEYMAPLSPVSLRIFREVLFSFPAGTGLGWDAVHPRALLRLDDDFLSQWLLLLERCEREGRWPTSVGVVVVVLIPNLKGGQTDRADSEHAADVDASPQDRSQGVGGQLRPAVPLCGIRPWVDRGCLEASCKK